MKNKLFAIIISSLLLTSGCGSGVGSGEGKKIGQIVKIGKHGLVCSTYEAEIIPGGFNSGSGVNEASLNFSIKSKKVYEGLVEAMENQQEIELHYSKHKFSGICYSETATIATGFTILEKPEKVETKELKKTVEVNKIVDDVEDI